MAFEYYIRNHEDINDLSMLYVYAGKDHLEVALILYLFVKKKRFLQRAGFFIYISMAVRSIYVEIILLMILEIIFSQNKSLQGLNFFQNVKKN